MLAGAVLLGCAVLLLPSADMALSRRDLQSGWKVALLSESMQPNGAEANESTWPASIQPTEGRHAIRLGRCLCTPQASIHIRCCVWAVGNGLPASANLRTGPACVHLLLSAAAASSSHPECNLVYLRCLRLARQQRVSTMQTVLKGASHLQVGLGAAVCQDHLQPCPCSIVCAQCRPPRLPTLASPGHLLLCQSGTMRGG